VAAAGGATGVEVGRLGVGDCVAVDDGSGVAVGDSSGVTVT
jgi:hypothetical protein